MVVDYTLRDGADARVYLSLGDNESSLGLLSDFSMWQDMFFSVYNLGFTLSALPHSNLFTVRHLSVEGIGISYTVKPNDSFINPIEIQLDDVLIHVYLHGIQTAEKLASLCLYGENISNNYLPRKKKSNNKNESTRLH